MKSKNPFGENDLSMYNPKQFSMQRKSSGRTSTKPSTLLRAEQSKNLVS